jgi:hypothetical protein
MTVCVEMVLENFYKQIQLSQWILSPFTDGFGIMPRIIGVATWVKQCAANLDVKIL